MAFTCPRCGMTSHHPADFGHGYCGRCRDWTAPPAAVRVPAGACLAALLLDPELEWTAVSPGVIAGARVTSGSRLPRQDLPDPLVPGPEPGIDAMRWSDGCGTL
jgi:hypothetical protein